MGQPAAKQGDRIVGTDVHLVPGTSIQISSPFNGLLNGNLCGSVRIMGRPAAVVGSTAINSPAHPPPIVATNLGRVLMGSSTVNIGGKPAARTGDTAMTCNDPADLPTGTVIGSGSVMIG